MLLLFAEMNGTEIALIITAVCGGVIGLVNVILAGLAALWAARAKYLSELNAASLTVVKENVATIEKHTNSMTEAQVDLADKLGQAIGEKRGRAEKAAEIKEEAKVAVVASPIPVQAPPVKVEIVPAAKPLPVVTVKPTDQAR